MADLKPYPAMKDSGVEWLGGGAGALGRASAGDFCSRVYQRDLGK